MPFPSLSGSKYALVFFSFFFFAFYILRFVLFALLCLAWGFAALRHMCAVSSLFRWLKLGCRHAQHLCIAFQLKLSRVEKVRSVLDFQISCKSLSLKRSIYYVYMLSNNFIDSPKCLRQYLYEISETRLISKFCD